MVDQEREEPEPAEERRTSRPPRSLSFNFQDMLAPVNEAFADVVRSIKTGGFDADLLMAYIVALDNIIPDETVQDHIEWEYLEGYFGPMWDGDGFGRMSREYYLDALHTIRNIAKSHGIVARGAAKEEVQLLDIRSQFEED